MADLATAQGCQCHHHGRIIELGDFATGLLAQSIGGGGGAGGKTINLQGAGGGNAVSAGVNLGGSGAKGGSAGNVSVSNTASITTGTDDSRLSVLYGNNSYGIYAQSVGGGGGSGGEAVSIQGALSAEVLEQILASMAGLVEKEARPAMSPSRSGEIKTIGKT